MDKAARRREWTGVLSLVAVLAFVMASYSILRHWHFRSSGFDLGIFTQALWKLSRFEAPLNSFKGGEHLFSDHFHPILLVLVPVFSILPRPETLLVAQALLLSLSVLPVWSYARERIGAGLGLGLAAAYGLFWGIQLTAAFDFHELAFAPLPIGIALLGVERRRPWLFWPAALVLLSVKEDVIPLLAAFGLLLLARRQWRSGLAAVAVSIATFAIALKLVIPAFGGGRGFTYGETFGGEPFTVAIGVLAHPAETLRALILPAVKLRTAFFWLAPFAFLPLLSPLSLVALPLVLERFLSSNPIHWATGYHYSAPFAPILAFAAVDGLVRLRGWLPSDRARALTSRLLVSVSILLCSILPHKLPLWRVLQPRYYEMGDLERSGARALAAIPPDASVVAQNAIAPHLSLRSEIAILRQGSPDADYVIAAADLNPWPNPDRQTIASLLDQRRAQGYRVAFEADGWIVLRRGPK